MFAHDKIEPEALRKMIRASTITWAGNRKLRIYGRLRCPSGMRMKRQNRVFFSSEEEAIEAGYRPCGHCLRLTYHEWRNGTV